MIVKNPRSKAVRNAFIGAGVLLVLLVGGGVAYTYFLGPDGTQPGAVAAPAAAPEPKFTPSKPAANAPESAAVQTVTTPVAPGANASVAVKTNAGSTCKISVVYNGVASTDSGLADKKADEYGTVSWAWTVGSTAPIGTWPVNITCSYNGKTAIVRADLVVAKS
jgi:hypothetical protein